MGRLEGKNVLITGASAGIGEACAREFAKEGSNVIVAARRVERLENLKKELEAKYPSIKVTAIQLDMRDVQQIRSVVAQLPPVDVLVNNAGMVLGRDPVAEVAEDAFDTMFNTNVKGLVFLTQAIIPSMKERQTGHIINLGSIAGKQAYPGGSIYCATKHAVDAITTSLRFELVDTPIRVSQICPGLVNTEFSTVRFYGDKEKADSVYKGMQPLVAQDIAEIVVFTAGRPPHVNIADSLVFPTSQADATTVHRSA
ncbi:short-chain dehydrogenase reductase sdr [Lichtheimia corymbifera JMRC:FSU:9682]|uniref:Short-chain dehydrogenase reductase sdr n=1 Tax=Lichtheimia corymbifera JMRC:FSU:9682 TaxID=1263082 RepID=A0A068SBV9_9FUNG|nr:short-chain dehydrogenase reductase sdr [Lichtheimia corymbifera JMRC:FSU:9682]